MRKIAMVVVICIVIAGAFTTIDKAVLAGQPNVEALLLETFRLNALEACTAQ